MKIIEMPEARDLERRRIARSLDKTLGLMRHAVRELAEGRIVMGAADIIHADHALRVVVAGLTALHGEEYDWNEIPPAPSTTPNPCD